MMMNAEIENIFQNFSVDGNSIPVAFNFYDGNADSWIVYSNVDADGSYSGDDSLMGFITFYDFEIYSKGNYFNILRAVISRMEEAGWEFQPSLCSNDQYDRDTKIYSKTLCFAKHVQI